MEKIDFLNCDEFKLIKKLMGISDNDKTDFTIVISADDPNLKSTPTGFTYKGRRVILYIRDQVQYGDKPGEYKFHLVDCATLKAKRNQNRYGKYVVSTSTSGKFKVNRIINNRSAEIFLIVSFGYTFTIKTDLNGIAASQIWKFYVMIAIKQNIITEF